MFRSLHVKNFAIIDDITIDFEDNMTVLTGETGAGKSLIIDATKLLLGARLTTKVVRDGFDKAIIEGVFENYPLKLKNLLFEYGIDELDDDILIIRREITQNSKSYARINSVLVSLGQLEKVGSYLMDIHTQNDTKKLFDNHNYLDFIDNKKCLLLLKEYQEKRNLYLKAYKEYADLKDKKDLDIKELDYFKYQYHELESAKLKIGELEDIENEIDEINNFEKINNLYLRIKNLNDENNIVATIYNLTNEIEKLAEYKDNYDNMVSRMNNAYYDIDDIIKTICDDYNNFDFDFEHLEYLKERMLELKTLERKFHLPISELILYKDQLKEKIDIFENIDDEVNRLENIVKIKYQELLEISNALSSERKISAKHLSDDVINTLNDLVLNNVKFEIAFNRNNPSNHLDYHKFTKDGLDVVDFLISFNLGQSVAPLRNVSSGGETSRIMLALKVHLLKQLNLSTIIFDEIDSGISRNVAFSVGKKMKEISNNTQVIAITHLPLVASFARSHLFISKAIKDDKTIVSVKNLNDLERINELAMMLDPNAKDSIQLKQIAKNMLENKN